MRYINYCIKLGCIFLCLLLINRSTNVRNTVVVNDNENRTINLTTMALKVVEIKQSLIFNAIDTYTGELTGYVSNCAQCSGKLACDSSYDISNGVNTYFDQEYGNVYIVASSKNLECGSIVSFSSSRISDEKIVAIVLDRGVSGNNLDFLATSEEYARNYIGRSTITYDVLRNGWNNEG